MIMKVGRAAGDRLLSLLVPATTVHAEYCWNEDWCDSDYGNMMRDRYCQIGTHDNFISREKLCDCCCRGC